jgi:hypothetical protein
MRNPLHYSSALLVKKAELNIPVYTPKVVAPTLSDEQIATLMTNIKSYPEAQQQQILDSINQNFGQAQYRGGLVGNALGGLGNYLGSFGDTLQQGVNWASQGLFGSKPFDTQDSDRYRAETVLQTAAKNPALYQKVTQGLQAQGIGASQQPSVATSAPAATSAPTATTASVNSTPAAANTGNAAAVAKRVLEGGYKAEMPKPGPMLPKLVSTSYADKSSPAAAPKRKEGLIEGVPASQWIAENKKRQKDEELKYKKSNPSTVPANRGLAYNATTGQYQQPGYNMYAGRVLNRA